MSQKKRTINLYLSRDHGPFGIWALWRERPQMVPAAPGLTNRMFDAEGHCITMKGDQIKRWFGLEEPSKPAVWRLTVDLDAIQFGDMEIEA